MNKYQPLSTRLADHAGSEWRANFAELEATLGFALPKVARAGKAWWKNDPATPQSRAWTEAGWEVSDIDQAAGLVTFRKSGGAALKVARAEAAPRTALTDEPAILQRLEATPKWGAIALVAGSIALVAGLGALMVRGVTRRKT
jgi:hypothetical protein